MARSCAPVEVDLRENGPLRSVESAWLRHNLCRRDPTPIGGAVKSEGGMAKKKDTQEAQAAAPPDPAEAAACNPSVVRRDKFNDKAKIPYGLTVEHLHQAMKEFIEFLGFINSQLHTKGIKRFESMLMPANFSSMV